MTLAREILNEARDMREVAAKLNEHADAVFGCRPESDTSRNSEGPTSPYSGAVGEIFEALFALREANHRVAEAAGRNTTLI